MCSLLREFFFFQRIIFSQCYTILHWLPIPFVSPEFQWLLSRYILFNLSENSWGILLCSFNIISSKWKTIYIFKNCQNLFPQADGPIRPGNSFLKSKHSSDRQNNTSSSSNKKSSKSHVRRSAKHASSHTPSDAESTSERAEKKRMGEGIEKEEDLTLKPLKKRPKKRKNEEVQ